VNAALNFENDGTTVEGGCDLFTIKKTRKDKKLESKIHKELAKEHESSLRFAASLSPPDAARYAMTENLARSSPFGSLSQVSNRRTYAYMIATLNASYPDYDFSNALDPFDFRREKRLDDIVNLVDTKVLNAHGRSFQSGLQTPGGSLLWGIKMWRIIDSEMDLEKCELYSWRPDEDPFDDDKPTKWALHYFFFNKLKKRVCYLYARARVSDQVNDWSEALYDSPKRKYDMEEYSDYGANKRARYWLGDSAEDEYEIMDADLLDEIVKKGRSISPIEISDSDTSEEASSSNVKLSARERRKSDVRAVSEGIAESIEI